MNISFYDAPTKAQWLQDLGEAFNHPEDLLNYLELDIANFEPDLSARKLFALRVPRPFAEKMKKGDSSDPLFFTGNVAISRVCPN